MAENTSNNAARTQATESTQAQASSVVQSIAVPTEPLPEDIDEHVDAVSDDLMPCLSNQQAVMLG